MADSARRARSPRFRRLVRLAGLLLGVWAGMWVGIGRAQAHPMPNSLVLLDMQPEGVGVELQLPLSELELAFGHQVAHADPATLVARLGPQLRGYLLAHLRPITPRDGRLWRVQVQKLRISTAEQTATGVFPTLVATLWLTPPPGESPRAFTLYYDVIVHQLVTHKALVAIRQDWESGIAAAERPAELGLIGLDARTNTVPPLHVNQAGDGAWRGFRSMVGLGVRHIAEGTDHLLFLLTLLLVAPLVVRGRRWGGAERGRGAFVRLLQVVTAFTLGHSLTLLAGAVGWLGLPGQVVEVLIAVSILISALHALRPLFPAREAYVALGFGLIHGLAFAGTLVGLHLSAGRLALSILGFNVGIELMQLLVISLTVPWLFLMSRTRFYGIVRVAGGVGAAIAAVAWLAERLVGAPNPVTVLVEQLAGHAGWLLVMLATLAAASFWWQRRQTPATAAT